MKAEKECRFIRDESVVRRDIAGQALLIPMSAGGVDLQMVYALNDAADAVWNLLGEERTLGQIVDALRREYDGRADLIGRDVEALIQDMLGRGLVLRRPADD
jgi:hypothetical protein